jgi:sugar phosphate isomerase/epimerase
MRLGGPINEPYQSPEQWCVAVHHLGYRAAYCPVNVYAGDETIAAYRNEARNADIIIAEVGVWNNPLSPDEVERQKSIAHNICCLELAEKIEARCCVNISGSRGSKWDGPCPLDLTDETFMMIVTTVRQIIDAVQPKRTFYTLETMPWMYPDSVESYVRLVEAIDRPAFAVHFDPVNLICSPQRYFTNGRLIQEFIQQLGSLIKSVHLKDILLRDQLTTHLDEVRPGLGGLDYSSLLRELNQLDANLPVMLEHLPSTEEYHLAGNYVRSAAQQEGIKL